MRKLSPKWPMAITFMSFLMPAWCLFFRIGHPETFGGEFEEKLVAAVFYTGIAWAVYGIACVFARKPKTKSEGRA